MPLEDYAGRRRMENAAMQAVVHSLRAIYQAGPG